MLPYCSSSARACSGSIYAASRQQGEDEDVGCQGFDERVLRSAHCVKKI
ncbi:MAG: hypothetical protein GQ469_02785 [Methanosarcinales archaeon]|nr:hypothetical protein [Methanosarcinales archaeon]